METHRVYPEGSKERLQQIEEARERVRQQRKKWLKEAMGNVALVGLIIVLLWWLFQSAMFDVAALHNP